MTYSLNTIVLEPLSKNKPKNAVILCHGYGGDGNDISILANYWKAHLPDTIFICPDAPEKCAASPTGFQWFDLMDQTPEQILSKSLVAENKLNKLIDEVKEKNNLKASEITIGGVTLGFGTAMLGEKAAMLCTASVEEVIDGHYKDQTYKLGEDEKELKEKIMKFRDDELHHKDIAYDNGATKEGLFGVLDKIIKTSSKIAITISQKI